MNYVLAPSILAADFKNLGEEMKKTEENGAGYIHFDVMDGMFVPSISFGMPVLKSIHNATNQFMDAHLMVQEPIRYVEAFKEAGADLVTVHLEACENVEKTISKIRECGMKVGLSICPETSEKEVEHLFKIINKLRDRGCGIVYISHKMEEIKAISDDITILRDGKWIATESVADLSTDQIINMMVGRDLTNRFPPKDNVVKECILKVEGLTAAKQPSINNISFELHKGEILGVAGLVGAKRTDIVETIFGIREKAAGNIFLNGKEVKNKTPNEAIENGFALVTEERRATGIYSMLNVGFNSTISNLDRYLSKFRLLSDKGIKKDTQWVIDSMRVKTPSQSTSIGSLSGGNQQKVILGRWLLTEPDVLMLDEPTRGIDVLAKFEIYQLMIELAKKDKGIIMISSEMPELLGVTDRILVMSNGRVAGIVKTSETTQEEIMTLSAKYL